MNNNNRVGTNEKYISLFISHLSLEHASHVFSIIKSFCGWLTNG